MLLPGVNSDVSWLTTDLYTRCKQGLFEEVLNFLNREVKSCDVYMPDITCRLKSLWLQTDLRSTDPLTSPNLAIHTEKTQTETKAAPSDLSCGLHSSEAQHFIKVFYKGWEWI